MMMHGLMRWEKRRQKGIDVTCRAVRKRCQTPMNGLTLRLRSRSLDYRETPTLVSKSMPQFYQLNMIAALQENLQRKWFLVQKEIDSVVVFHKLITVIHQQVHDLSEQFHQVVTLRLVPSKPIGGAFSCREKDHRQLWRTI